MRQLIRNNTVLRRLYYRTRLLQPTSEADERRILTNLAKAAPKTFVEFGFHPIEFNCVEFARDPAWSGLLIDGSKRQVDDAQSLWPSRLEFVERFLTLDNLDFIRNRFPQLGVLSVDVDGNDYWFLKALINTSPTVISVEYNSTLGFEPITVPYDETFDRHQKHPLGWYHGASLTALAKLLRRAWLRTCCRLRWKLQRVFHETRKAEARGCLETEDNARTAFRHPARETVGRDKVLAVRDRMTFAQLFKRFTSNQASS